MISKVKNFISNNTWVWALLGAFFLWLTMGISSGRLNLESFLANAYAASFIAIIAFGQMLVISTGRGAIDLSIPGVLTLMAFVSMKIINGQDSNLVLAIVTVLALCTLIGILNSLIVIYLRIPAIIGTMAMNYILTTAALLINKNFSIFAIAPTIQAVTRTRILGVPLMIYVTLALAFVLWLVINKTAYGKSLMAIGQNYDAAKLAGIKVVPVEMFTYVLSSIMAGVAGVLISARVGGALLGMGDAYLLETIASIVIGGTLISGGKANVPGTLAGCLFLGLVVTAMQIIGFSIGAQKIAKGTLIIVVLIAATRQHKPKEVTSLVAAESLSK